MIRAPTRLVHILRSSTPAYFISDGGDCGTLKCENAAICEKVAKCEKNSTLNVKIDAMCEKITLNVKK